MQKLLIFILLSLAGPFALTSCSDVSGSQSQKSGEEEFAIVDVDGNDVLLKVKRDNRGEIVVDDSTLKEMKQVVNTSANSFENDSKKMTDSSQVITMNDGYGNKVETRTFNGDSRLKQVVVRSFTNGNVRVFVYGINGEVRSVPDEFKGKVLAASAREIANVAGIFERRQETNPSFDNTRNLEAEYAERGNVVQNIERPNDQRINSTPQTQEGNTQRISDNDSPERRYKRPEKEAELPALKAKTGN